MIEKFWNLNLVKEPADIFKLDFKKIEKLDGWGELSIDNLKKAINSSRKISLDKMIYSIGIRHIGQENAKTIAGFFGKLNKFKEIFEISDRRKIISNLLELDGIGDTQVNSINNFFSNQNNLRIIKDLIKELIVKDYIVHKGDGIFK